MSDDDYEVGYGKPPKHSQFRTGQSGNEKGRKPRVKNAGTLLALELDQFIVARDGEKEVRITKREAFVKSLVNDAITNKAHARALLIRLLDISPPPEPFIASDEDHAAVTEFIKRARRQQPELNEEDNADEQE